MSSELDKETVLTPATTDHSKEIRPINKETVHKICSGQVVLSLAVAVKELVENAIDAGATSIEIRLKEYGSDLIEVIDNGSGVEKINFEALTLKHHTSKISQFSDLSFVSTLGFRGEALSSLCALADLTVVTRHMSVEVGTKIEYDHNGHIKNKTPCARQIGTTVSLTNLFASLPVRHKDFQKNLKREFAKMLELLYAYCIISGVRILCTNQTKKGPRTTIVTTNGSKFLKDNIICVFGVKQMENLIEFVLHRPEDKVLEEYSLQLLPAETIPFTFEGYISKCSHGSGRSTSDRQFFFINGRPCVPNKLIKVINEVYRSFNGNQYPFIVLNIKTNQAQVDVNVTPDKRQIFLEHEKLLLATAKMSLLEMFKEFPCTLKMQNLDLKTAKVPEENQNTSNFDILKHFKHKDTVLNDNKRGIKRKEATKNTKYEKQAKGILSFIYEKRMKINDDNKQDLSEASASEDEEKQIKKFIKESYNSDDSDVDNNISTQKINDKLLDTLTDLNKSNELKYSHSSSESDNDIKNISTQSISDDLLENLNHLANNTTISTPKQNLDVTIEETPSCKINVRKLKEFTVDINEIIEPESEEYSYDSPKLSDSQNCSQKSNVIDTSIKEIEKLMLKNMKVHENEATQPIVKFRSEITSDNAEKELRKQISKYMFEKMEILGQFNKGFIITKLDADLFIIDQHATDEKYNFEILQQTTVLENQILVNPKPLDLTAANECMLIDNIEVFTKNGFVFQIDENAEPRKKVSLTAIPMSKNYQFGKEDIDELLFMLQEDSMSNVYRPSRVRAMFASRACRKSVMIGSALSQSDMRKLVDHMGQIEQPWNCPHGRPTMRHLINLNLIQEAK